MSKQNDLKRQNVPLKNEVIILTLMIKTLTSHVIELTPIFLTKILSSHPYNCQLLKLRLSVRKYFFQVHNRRYFYKTGFVSATESLLGRGASVTVTDNRALNPLLACAPNDDVVICLGMMLSVFLSRYSLVPIRRHGSINLHTSFI